MIVDSNVAPVITCPTSISIVDNTAVGTVVSTIIASDRNVGVNGTFRFSLTQRLPTPQSGIYFTIDPINGEISTDGELDFSRRSIFTVLITVSDLAVDPLSDTCDITVNIVADAETPPIFPHNPIVVHIDEIPSNAPVYFENQRRQVFNLEAYNPNTASVEGMHYNLKLHNPGALATLDQLTFDGVTFSVDEHARALYVTGPVDREKESSYTFEVQAYLTQPMQFTEATVLVFVNDVNEPPHWSQSLYITYLSERAEVGDTIYHLTAQDNDIGLNAELRYSMLGRIASDTIDGEREYFDTNSVFTVNEFGVIKINQTIGFGYYRFFQFTARTTDQAGDMTAGESVETEMLIVIVDVNDHEPMFSPLNYTQIKCENHADDMVVPHFLITVTAYDPDHGDAGAVTFSISGVNASSFRVYDTTYVYPHSTSTNANVTTTAKVDNTVSLDAETTPLYVLNIDATEITTDDPKIGHGHMFFRVCDYNDHTPYFEQSAGYTTSVEENVEDDILIVRVFDDDATLQNQISTLAITAGNPNSLFHLQEADERNTWFLWAVNLDYEEAIQHTLTLTATNDAQTYVGDCHGICLPRTRVQTVQVVINVIDRNDNCPFFQPTHYDNINIDENAASGTAITTLTAMDNDQPDTAQSTPVFYMKTDTSRGLFQVNETTGVVTVHNSPDFEDIHQITLGVFVHDRGGAHGDYLCPEVEATVEIDIINLNDNPPVCVGCPYYVDCIDEDDTQGTFVVKVITTDVDWDGLSPGLRAGSAVFYSIVSQTTDGAFVIDNGTGVITVSNNALLDREGTPGHDTHTITVRAFDGLHNSTDITVTVKICDVNDNCPTFTSDRTPTATVSETDEGGNAGFKVPVAPALMANDIDVTDINVDTVFVITDSDPPDAPFRMDRYTGDLFVSSEGVDYEDVTQYTLTVVTYDEANQNCPVLGVAEAYANITIMITNGNDQDPVFGTTVYRPPPVPEGSISNGIVLQVLDVSDPDGFGVTVTSTLEPNIPSGAIFVESQGDGWVLKVAGVTNVDPVVLDRDDTSLTRDPLSGNLLYIVSLTATDSPAMGKKRQAGATRQAFATAYVEVYDVNDNTPVITPSETITRNVPENAHAGYIVAHIAATDADWGTNADIHYYLDPLQTDFTIGSDSGTIATVGSLDHERMSSYSFQACAADRGTPTVRSACVNVSITVGDVQDSCPLLSVSPLSVTINEGTVAVDTDLGISVSAVDRDSTVDNTITLSVVPAGGPFAINSTAAQGTVTGGIVRVGGMEVDHEALSVYHITVTASDGSCSDAVVVKVVVDDLPDVPPVLTSEMYSGSISEGSPAGSIVPVTPGIGAVDLDIELDTDQQDPDDALTYSLVSITGQPPIDSIFSINQGSLSISLREGAILDYEAQTSYIFEVVVTDRGSNTDTGTVTVTITDVNDNEPIFDVESLYNASRDALATVTDPTDPCYGITIDPTVAGTRSLNVSVPETAQVNCRLLGPGVSLAPYVTDADSGTNGEIWFKADHGDDENIGVGSSYPVDSEDPSAQPADAILFIHERLDYEVKIIHTLTIRAIDRGAPPSTSSLFIYVHVLNSNDNPPIFEIDAISSSYCEETDTRVGVVKAVDRDGDNVTYSVVSVNPATLMSNVRLMIVEESAEVWLNGVDYESVQQVVITIEANDNREMPLTDMAVVTVEVLDVNDNAPTITNVVLLGTVPFFTRINEDPFHPDTPIITVTGTDVDTGFNEELDFQIVSQSPGAKFTLNSISGELWPNATLDYEEYPGPYTVNFRVCDKGDQGVNRALCANHTVMCSTTRSIVINITNLADHPPVCPDVIQVSVLENDNIMQRAITNLVCTDADYPDDPLFLFNIISVVVLENDAVTAAGSFSVVPAMGPQTTLQAEVALDREGIDEYVVTVEVEETHNGAGTGLKSLITVVVSINDTNDEPPVFPTDLPMEVAGCAGTGSVSVSEDTQVNHHLFNLAAHDPDLNPKLTYQITSVTPAHSDYFVMAPNGSLILTNHVDFEEIRDTYNRVPYTISLSVNDSLHTATTAVCVGVTDANDNEPIFVPPSRTLMVNECMAPGHLADLTGYAGDADDPPNSNLMYALQDPTPGDPSHPNHVPFGVVDDGGTYWIDVTHALDFETTKVYDVVVVATDQPADDSRSLSGHATIRIEVEDCADVTPCFNQTDLTVFAPENTTDTLKIYGNLTHHVFDLDTVPEEFFLFVINPPEFSLVTVGSKSGEVFLHADNTLDFEDSNAKEQKVTVAVRNSNAHPTTMDDYILSGFIDVTVVATDINDNPPVIDAKSIYARPGNGYILIPVDHLTEYGEAVGRKLTATDVDSGDYGRVQFRRHDPPSGEPFFFDVTQNGSIITLASLKDRIGTTYNFTVEAYDNYLRSDPVYFSDFVVIKVSRRGGLMGGCASQCVWSVVHGGLLVSGCGGLMVSCAWWSDGQWVWSPLHVIIINVVLSGCTVV
jgi:hypothetical protein